MMSSQAGTYPTVVFSSVVRSTHKGDSHGGLYLADLATQTAEQVLDWSDASIDWEGRGGDRGLRGIAFHEDRMFLSASDEIFIYDRNFQLQTSFRNRYLKRCHEITVAGDRLFLTSTGFDSVLEYDLEAGLFVRGHLLRYPRRWRKRRKLHLRPRPKLTVFDPTGADGPVAGDTCHINNVFHEDGALYVSGTGLGYLWRIVNDRLERYARVPYGSHNARPFRGGVLLNHTATNRIVFTTRSGRIVKSFPVQTYDQRSLVHSDLPSDRARPSFARGLAVKDGLIIGGSSPATVTLYDFGRPRALCSVNVTMDVRNAIHGLEVWPFGAGP
jgi:hypothetical protein